MSTDRLTGTEPEPSTPRPQSGLSSRELRTIGLGILLAILVVPLGGPQAPLGILIIALLVVVDLYRGRRKAGL